MANPNLPDLGDLAAARTGTETPGPSSATPEARNRVLEGILATARIKLEERGIDLQGPFPASEVRDLIPGRRMCLEAVYRAIGRRKLVGAKVGRVWFTDWQAFVAWVTNSSPVSGDVASGAHGAEAAHRRVGRRLHRTPPARTRIGERSE